MKRRPSRLCRGPSAALSLGALLACGQPSKDAPPQAAPVPDAPAQPPSPAGKPTAVETPPAKADRDTTLREAKAAIEASEYARATALLTPLVDADETDAEAHYNLGLIAQHRGRYNQARSGYLAALRARPAFADARYNLAILTWNRNVEAEARHHVARFVERWPSDPRAKKLLELTGPP